jgi:hypothetical protein
VPFEDVIKAAHTGGFIACMNEGTINMGEELK